MYLKNPMKCPIHTDYPNSFPYPEVITFLFTPIPYPILSPYKYPVNPNKYSRVVRQYNVFSHWNVQKLSLGLLLLLHLRMRDLSYIKKRLSNVICVFGPVTNQIMYGLNIDLYTADLQR